MLESPSRWFCHYPSSLPKENSNDKRYQIIKLIFIINPLLRGNRFEYRNTRGNGRWNCQPAAWAIRSLRSNQFSYTFRGNSKWQWGNGTSCCQRYRRKSPIVCQYRTEWTPKRTTTTNLKKSGSSRINTLARLNVFNPHLGNHKIMKRPSDWFTKPWVGIGLGGFHLPSSDRCRCNPHRRQSR